MLPQLGVSGPGPWKFCELFQLFPGVRAFWLEAGLKVEGLELHC